VDLAEALRIGQGHRRGAPTPEFFGIHLIERPDQDRRVAGINRLRLGQWPRVDTLNGESEENKERERERERENEVQRITLDLRQSTPG
jgi:hypothetical protein